MSESIASTRLELPLIKYICSINSAELAKRIDYAVLKPWVSRAEVEEAVKFAESSGLRCLIVTPTLLPLVAGIAKCCVGAVAGFPSGFHTLEAKIKEVEDLISIGAREIDFVMNYQALLQGKEDLVKNEVRAIVTICKETGVKCKVIVELPAYDNYELAARAVRIAAEAEPDFIKTSSGHGPRPTVPEDIILVSLVLTKMGLKGKVGIKAAGGIRSAAQALTFLHLGADVIGTSTPKQILDGLRILKQWCASLWQLKT